MNKKGQLGWIILAVVGIIFFVAAGYAIKYFLLPVKTVTTQIDSASDIIPLAGFVSIWGLKRIRIVTSLFWLNPNDEKR